MLPNILFILSDQQRWDTLGGYGQKLPLTPHLDQLAKEGSLFRYAFSPQPVCGPARACLQTGRYPSEIGCHLNERMLPESETTVAKELKKTDYETSYIGKWHLDCQMPWDGPDHLAVKDKVTPIERRGGYTDYWCAVGALECTSHGYGGFCYEGNGKKREFPPERYRADVLTDWAIEYLTTRKQDKPFFHFISYIEPHQQNDRNCFEPPREEIGKWTEYEVPGDLIGLEGDWKRNFPDYLGCVRSLDNNVGRLIATLKELNSLENTIIVYTSDHGCHFKTRNEEYKRSCHEASIRIPLIIRGPGFRGGRIIEEMVSLLDLAPTLLTAGNVPIPATMRGRALQGLAAGHCKDWPQEVLIQLSESQIGRVIRTRKWKYSVAAEKPGISGKKMYYYQMGQGPWTTSYFEDCLYDLENDPHEQINLVSDPRYIKVREELSQQLCRQVMKIGEPKPAILPNSLFQEYLRNETGSGVATP